MFPGHAQMTSESTASTTEPSSKTLSTSCEVSTTNVRASHLGGAVGQGGRGHSGLEVAEDQDTTCGGDEPSKQLDDEHENSPAKNPIGTCTLLQLHGEGVGLQLIVNQTATPAALIGTELRTGCPQAISKAVYAFEKEEKRWRSVLWKQLHAQDKTHRTAVSKALNLIRRTPQWRCANLQEKMQFNEAEIAHVSQSYAATSRGHHAHNDHMVKNGDRRPLKRKWLSNATSTESLSTATFDTEGVDSERSRSAAWVESLNKASLESVAGGWDNSPTKKRSLRAVTGVVRDFMNPYENCSVLEGGRSVAGALPSSTKEDLSASSKGR